MNYGHGYAGAWKDNINLEFLETTIRCVSSAERKMRIADLNLRGFEVARLFIIREDFGQDASKASRGRTSAGGKRDAVYGAVLRRPNDNYIKKEGELS